MDIERFNGKMGRVLQASKGAYHTYEPNPLPCKIEYDTELVKILSDALTSVGNLSGIGYRMTNPHLLMTPYIKKEAVFSSKIEGTRTTLSEIFINETGEDIGEKDDIQEVVNYINALEYGLKEIQNGVINEELIKKIKSLPPDKLAEVVDFVDFLRQRGDDRRIANGMTKLAEDAFRKVWDNPDDARYDRL